MRIPCLIDTFDVSMRKNIDGLKKYFQHKYARVRACVRACVRECVSACVRVCVNYIYFYLTQM